MALAAFEIVVTHGISPGTEEVVANNALRFADKDEHDPTPGSNSLPAPQSGVDPSVFSYEKSLKFRLTAPPDNSVSNMKIYGSSSQPDSDDTPGNKVTIFVGTNATYTTPTNAQSTLATANMHTTHFSEASALAIAGTLVNIGDDSDYIVFQERVEFGALQGDKQTATISMVHEEN